MSTEQVVQTTTSQVAEFNKTESALAILREKFAVAPDCKTKEGYEECRVGLRELVSLRTGLDKLRKELDRDDRARIKFRSDEAKRILGELSPMEDRLRKAKDAIDDAIEKAKEEKRLAEENRINKITEVMNSITQCGNVDPTMESGDIKAMEAKAAEINVDFDFEEFADAAEAERKRVLAFISKTLLDRVEFEEQQREQTRIAQEQAEQQRLLDERQAEIDRQQAEQQKKIDDQQAEIDRQKTEAAAEEERKAAEAKAEEERKAAEAKAEEDRKAAEEEERKRLADEEESREDREAVINWANKLRFIDGPNGITNEHCKTTVSAALITLDTLANHVVRKMGGK